MTFSEENVLHSEINFLTLAFAQFKTMITIYQQYVKVAPEARVPGICKQFISDTNYLLDFVPDEIESRANELHEVLDYYANMPDIGEKAQQVLMRFGKQPVA